MYLKPGKTTYSAILFSSLILSVLTNVFLYIGQLLIVRTLTRDSYSMFVVAVSFVAMLALAADLGIAPFVTKSFAEADEKKHTPEGDSRGRLLGSYLALRLLLSLAVAILIVVLSNLIGYHHEEIVLMVMFLPSLIISSRFMIFRSTGESLLKSQDRFHIVAIYAFIDSVLFAIAMYFAYSSGGDVYIVMGVYTFSNIPGFIFLFIRIYQWTRKEKLQIVIDKRIMRSSIRSALPLAIGTAFLAIHNNIDTLLLDALSSSHQVSAYGASLRLLSALIFIPSIFGGVIAPLISRAIYLKTSESLISKVHQLLAYLLSSAALIGIIISLTPDILISVFLGSDKYTDIREIVVVFGWTFIPISFVTFCSELAIAEGKLWMPTIYLSVVLVLSLISDLILIPVSGAYGAAIAKCISVSIGSLVFLLLIGQLKTIKYSSMSKLLLLLSINVAIILTVSSIISPMIGNPVISMVILILLFVGLLISFKVIKHKEVKDILGSIFFKKASSELHRELPKTVYISAEDSQSWVQEYKTDDLPLVTLGILSYNRRNELRATLDVVTKAVEYSNKEVIVVDNGSDDGTIQMVANEFPDITMISLPTNKGTSSRNYILNNAKGKYIFLFDDDSFPATPFLVSKAVSYLESRQDISVLNMSVYQHLNNVYESDDWEYFSYNRIEEMMFEGVFFVEGGVCIRTKDISSCRFDEGNMWGAEGMDISLQLFKQSKRMVLDSSLQVLHVKAGIGHPRVTDAFHKSSSVIKMLFKHFPLVIAWILVVFYCCRRLVGAVVRPETVKYYFQGIIDGLRNRRLYADYSPKFQGMSLLHLGRWYLFLYRW